MSAGFFPESKHDGCVAIFNASAHKPSDTTIFMTPGCGSGDNDPFFYHKVEWVDMDNDGDLDMLTVLFDILCFF